MTDTQQTPSTAPAAPRGRMWIFFVILAIFAGAMYGGTMYRIKTAGFMGAGQDQLAHPKEEQSQTTPSAATQPATPAAE